MSTDQNQADAAVIANWILGVLALTTYVAAIVAKAVLHSDNIAFGLALIATLFLLLTLESVDDD